jgi:hypothetical protein
MASNYGGFRGRWCLLGDGGIGSRGVSNGMIVGKLRLPTDPIGLCTRIFEGISAGCEIRVYDPDRNELAGVESSTANPTLAWSAFAPGSPNNTVRIVIIDLAYRIKEFNYTSSVGSASIPVQQEPDKWFSNPA